MARLDELMDHRGLVEHGDYWEYFAHRRHHMVQRQDLFGHNEEAEYPWRIAPVVRDAASTRRRTTVITQNPFGMCTISTTAGCSEKRRIRGGR